MQYNTDKQRERRVLRDVGKGGSGVDLAWIENSAVDEYPQHVCRSAALNSSQSAYNAFSTSPRVRGTQFQRAASRNMSSRTRKAGLSLKFERLNPHLQLGCTQ